MGFLSLSSSRQRHSSSGHHGRRHGTSSQGQHRHHSNGSPRKRHHGISSQAGPPLATHSSEEASDADEFYAGPEYGEGGEEEEDGAYYDGEYAAGDYADGKHYNTYYYYGGGGGEDSDGEGNDAANGDGNHPHHQPTTPGDGEGNGEQHQHQHQQPQPSPAHSGDERCYQSSVTSSVRAHVYENGLRYHAFQGSAGSPRGGKLYALPNDETEQNRDDMKHAMTLLLMKGQHFYAPVHQRLAAGGQVYDLGTGTGIWAIEMADKYPRSVIHGVDLSPIQPNYVPDNVFFAVDDFEDDWTFPPDTFDLVHMRHALWAVDDRPALLRRIFQHLKPGGYVEFQELLPDIRFDSDGDSNSGEQQQPNALRDFIRYVGMGMHRSHALAGGDIFPGGGAEDGDAGGTLQQPPPPADALLAYDLQAAGFRGVRATTHRCPLGVWAKHKHLRRSGMLLRTALMDGLRGWAARPLGTAAGGLGWTPTQIEIFLVDVRKAVMDPAVRAYFPLHVVYAQKPME